MAADQWALRRLALGGTCPSPGGLEAYCAWRLVCSVRRYWWSKSALLDLDVRSLQGFGEYFDGWLAGILW